MLRRLWARLDRRQQLHAVVLLVVTVGAVGHQWVFWSWFIEDAAISFAYARNLASFEGLVPFPGGERVEGYSNPSWVFLLALFELIGIESFTTAKFLQAALCAGTIPLTYLIACEAIPDRRSHVPLIAPVAVAASSQFAIWGGSGLENSLFSFLLAAALLRMLREARLGGLPVSALLFFLVAITRPEAVLYAAAGGFSFMVFTLYNGRGPLPTVKWLVAFFVPFIGYHAIRYWYFAWPWPNTYYAKLDHKTPQPMEWNKRGWKYIRNFSHQLGHGYFLPVYLLGLLGARRWRLVLGTVATVSVLVLLYERQRILLPALLGCAFVAVYAAAYRRQGARPASQPTVLWAVFAAALVGLAELTRYQGYSLDVPIPEWWSQLPPWVLVPLVALLPLASTQTPGWQARVACWLSCGASVFFAIWALADWMAGFRWMSMLVVPASVLFAAGVGGIADLAQRAFSDVQERWTGVGWGTAVLVTLGMIPANINYTVFIASDKETSPFSVRRRVQHMEAVRDRIGLEGKVTLLDVDQGAHLWWSDYQMLDIAGLIDMPMGHHKFERAFIREYLFEEKKPEFAHVHGNWASNSKIPTHPEWRRDYIEVPGYPAGKNQFHVGNHIRKDLILTEEWPWEGNRRVEFIDGIVMEGWRIPSPAAALSRRFYVEVAFDSRKRKKGENFRVLMFLAGEGDTDLAVWDIAMGYDWYPPHQWTTKEKFYGRYALQLPPDLPVGTYDLGFVVLAAGGHVLAARIPGASADGEGEQVGPTEAVLSGGGPRGTRLARGEVRFPGAMEVVTLDRLSKAAMEDRDAAYSEASKGRCLQAEDLWWQAKMHRPRGTTWINEHTPRASRRISDCWVQVALTRPDKQVEMLERARIWDHWTPSLLEAVEPIADELYAMGMAAREAGQWEAAYRAFADVMRIDPTRSWARRYAEEARARRLGFDAESKARKEEEIEAKKVEQQQKLEEAAREEAPPAAPDGDAVAPHDGDEQ